MPVEFSVAAYRFGHSMVRPTYDLNENEQTHDRPIFDPDAGPGDGGDLRGFQRLLPDWSLKWQFFFAVDEPPQGSRLIDTKLAKGLATLPFAEDQPNLAARNLLRGNSLGLLARRRSTTRRLKISQ